MSKVTLFLPTYPWLYVYPFIIPIKLSSLSSGKQIGIKVDEKATLRSSLRSARSLSKVTLFQPGWTKTFVTFRRVALSSEKSLEPIHKKNCSGERKTLKRLNYYLNFARLEHIGTTNKFLLHTKWCIFFSTTNNKRKLKCTQSLVNLKYSLCKVQVVNLKSI